MGRIGVQKEPSTCLFQIKFPYIERKWDKEEGKKAETWAGETWKQRRGKSQVRWNAEGREGMRGVGEERRWSWPAVGGGVWAQVDTGFPVALIGTGRQNRCPDRSCRCDQFLQEEQGFAVSPGAEGLTWGWWSLPWVLLASADVLTSEDVVASTALGSLWIKATCRTSTPYGRTSSTLPPYHLSLELRGTVDKILLTHHLTKDRLPHCFWKDVLGLWCTVDPGRCHCVNVWEKHRPLTEDAERGLGKVVCR